MGRIRIVAVLAATLLLAFGACKKDKKEAGGDKPATEEGGGGGGAAKPAEPAKTEYKALDVLGGLQIEIPGDADISDTSGDAPGVTISSSACTIMISEVTPMYPETFDKAKEGIQKDPNPFVKFTKEEEIEGGWHLEYELKSMMDEAPLYGTSIRRTFGDKQYECGRNDSDQAKVACTAKACLSLKQ